ncbi:MAG: hypothetical protein MUE99_12230 [Chitinophagaceae bacterium]|nr:hypothetical protein [Chitinophagaceae bacterium]
MEIHHHVSRRNEKRKWHHYFWEFLMLFLAVFLGFWAHYQLEHKIEREREKRYIISMVKDLYVDTMNFSKLISDGQQAMILLDSMMLMMNNPQPQQHAPHLYLMARRVTHIINPYEIFDRTYAAMKSSGNLRLLEAHDVADNITTYYSDIPTLQSQQQYIFNLLLQYIRDVSEVFDPAVFHKMYHTAGLRSSDTSDASTHRNLFSLPEIEQPNMSKDPQAIRRLSGTIHYLYARILSTNSNVRNQKKSAAALMHFLIKKYQLENELKAPAKN